MKITDQDIVRTAQELRDEENEQLHVRHWAKGEKAKRLKAENNTSLSSTTFQLFNFSTFTKWLVAVPAAAIIGFVFGFWTQMFPDPHRSKTVPALSPRKPPIGEIWLGPLAVPPATITFATICSSAISSTNHNT